MSAQDALKMMEIRKNASDEELGRIMKDCLSGREF
jgi:hypothetical protein